MSKKIIFHTNNLCERGVSVAVYDYAFYIRKFLNFNPLIVYNLNFNNFNETVLHFKKEFEVVGYENFNEIQTLVDKKNIDYFYAIKYGNIDGIQVNNCKNLIHSVFCRDDNHIHGNVYAFVSEWMSKETNYKIPYVPHMVDLPTHEENYRKKLNIPEEAIVIGRYGGKETFNIDFVVNSINKLLECRKDIWFLFANTDIKINNSRCLFLPEIIDKIEKVKFINTCDAFLHARDYGETFGLSILEFASKNKQIITYDNFDLQTQHPLGGRNHFLFLNDNCFKYHNEETFNDIILNINKNNPFNTNYLKEQYSPKSTIKKFNEIFLT